MRFCSDYGELCNPLRIGCHIFPRKPFFCCPYVVVSLFLLLVALEERTSLGVGKIEKQFINLKRYFETIVRAFNIEVLENVMLNINKL